MKKNMFTLIIAAAAMIAGTTFVSCEKEDGPEAKVIKSEVLDAGSNPIDVVTDGISGTQLAYESWIRVNVETKASGEQVVKAKLQADILASVFEVKADGFEPQPVEVSYSYREDGRKTEGYVTTIDSVMICRLDYGAFAYEQELKYQVAVYDDGVSKQTMPYHRFGELQVGDYTLSALDNATIRGVEYERMLFRQQLKTTFGEQQYVMNNCIVLLKYVSGTEIPVDPNEVYQTKTEILDMGYSDISGGCKSWLKARQYFSDGYTKDVECSVTLYGGSNEYIMSYIELPSANIKLESYEIKEGQTTLSRGVDQTKWVDVYTEEVICALQYNQFSAEVYFVRDVAYYHDDIITYPMPCIDGFAKFVVEEPIVRFVKNNYTETDGNFASWYFEQYVSAEYNGYTFRSGVSRQIIVK